MTQLLTWIIVAYGLTNILMFGSILDKPRTYLRSRSVFIDELLSCPMCVGFHVGWILYILYYSLITVSYTLYGFELFINLFLTACFTSGAVWALNAIIEFFENKNK